jgi:hypothetical protein
MSGYEKTGWTDGTGVSISAANLNKIEYGMESIHGFDNAQALRDQPAPTHTTTAVTLGALSCGDGGYGFWCWDASSNAADNLITVLLPKNYGGSGRWIRQTPNNVYHAAWSGRTDEIGLQQVIDAIPGTGGVVIIDRVYEINAPVVIDKAYIGIKGLATQQTLALGSQAVIRKSNTFSGAAALIVGNPNDSRAHFVFSDFLVAGNNRSGDGIQLINIGNVYIHNVVSRDHLGRGVVFDGVWLSSIYDLHSKFNGSGGIELNGYSRANANLEFYGPVSQQNGSFNWLFTGNGVVNAKNVRPAAINIHGGIAEFPGTSAEALVKIECGKSINFFGTSIPNDTDATNPLIKIGGLYTEGCESIYFWNNFLQPNGNNILQISGNNIVNIGIIKPFLSRFTAQELINTSGMTQGYIDLEHWEFINATEINDPDNRIKIISDYGIGITQRLNTIQKPFTVKSTTDDFNRLEITNGNIDFGNGSTNVDARLQRRDPGIVGTPDDNSIQAGNGQWDGGHLILGTHHLWIYQSRLRIKSSAPTAPDDGLVVGSQT